jgi:hypothetical protein
MSERFFFGAPIVIGLAAAVAGCDDFDDGYYGHGENEIVFGIRQRVEPTTGKTELSAGYEFLGLANKGGWVTNVFRDGDGDGTCYFERYDDRLGPLRVESGVATWSGGKLPENGLQVLANQTEPTKLEAQGWGADDILTFDVTGFAMPRLSAVHMNAPRMDLAITGIVPAVAEGASEATIKPSDDVGVTWTPTPRESATRVMVTLETEEEGSAGGGVRCFASSHSGSVVIPAKWVARLFSSVDPAKPIQGHVAVASHKQVTYYAKGGWTAYIVATTEHRAQPFRGER